MVKSINYLQPLSEVISCLKEELHISQISYLELGEFPGAIPIYNKYDTVSITPHDWEYAGCVSDRVICVRFWKDDDYIFTENDYANLECLARFIVLYAGNVQGITEAIKNDLSKELSIESRMIDALEQGEFVVYYQPKVDLVNNCLIGAEALVRWMDGDKIVLPGDFIPVFEKNGFVCRLDYYVLETVLKDMRNWLDAGLEIVKTSVNFSRVHLSSETFTKRIIALLKKYDIPAEYIEIEFTETGDTDAAPMLENAILTLKEYGIATAMDDFGTGYSSLSLLTNLSFDILKIDKSFLEPGKISEREKVVINNIVRMVQDLNIDVIMEGVETTEQVDFLRKVNCNKAQGFIFDRPLPIENFEKRLINKIYPRELTA